MKRKKTGALGAFVSLIIRPRKSVCNTNFFFFVSNSCICAKKLVCTRERFFFAGFDFFRGKCIVLEVSERKKEIPNFFVSSLTMESLYSEES